VTHFHKCGDLVSYNGWTYSLDLKESKKDSIPSLYLLLESPIKHTSLRAWDLKNNKVVRLSYSDLLFNDWQEKLAMEELSAKTEW